MPTERACCFRVSYWLAAWLASALSWLQRPTAPGWRISPGFSSGHSEATWAASVSARPFAAATSARSWSSRCFLASSAAAGEGGPAGDAAGASAEGAATGGGKPAGAPPPIGGNVGTVSGGKVGAGANVVTGGSGDGAGALPPHATVITDTARASVSLRPPSKS